MFIEHQPGAMQAAHSLPSPSDISTPRASAAANSGLVPSLDPLRADATFALLPSWNARADIVSIHQALSAMLPTAYGAASMSVPEAIAALRDLGMMASSLARHGVEPTRTIPHLEERLLQLGDLVDMVPRDTVYHYGLWNPSGARQRSFTGAAAEHALIESARMAAPALDATLASLCKALVQPLESEQFVARCRRAAEQLEMILAAIGKAKSDIPPAFFARTLRPYFAELELGGQVFRGASAAPLSVCMVDHLLWSSDCRDRRFRQFQRDQIRYNLPHWRRLYDNTLGQPSLVTRLTQAFMRNELPSADAIEATTDLLQVLITFRGRHRFVAMRAYSAQVRKFEVGSGGYGVDTLEHILLLTRGASKQLRSLLAAPLEPGLTAPLEPGLAAPLEPGLDAHLERGLVALLEPGSLP